MNDQDQRQWTAEDLKAASQRGDVHAIAKAHDDGLLADVLANPGTAAQGAPRNV